MLSLREQALARVQELVRDLPHGSFSDEDPLQRPHKSGCATNDAPAMEPGPCTCDSQVEVVIDAGDKYNSVHLHGRTATSWQANLLIELTKLMSGAWPEGVNEKGEQLFRLPAPDAVIGRAVAITDALLGELAYRRWTAPIPSMEELRKDGGGNVGFTARREP